MLKINRDLRHCSARLLYLESSFPGWVDREHLKAYEELAEFDRDVATDDTYDLSSDGDKFGCSYCKKYHEACWFSEEEL
jgi:hypothetical protein